MGSLGDVGFSGMDFCGCRGVGVCEIWGSKGMWISRGLGHLMGPRGVGIQFYNIACSHI